MKAKSKVKVSPKIKQEENIGAGKTRENNDGTDVEMGSSDQQCLVLPDILNNRKQPINGKICFFSEATFRRVAGAEPTFKEKLLMQLSEVNQETGKTKQKEKGKKTASETVMDDEENIDSEELNFKSSIAKPVSQEPLSHPQNGTESSSLDTLIPPKMDVAHNNGESAFCIPSKEAYYGHDNQFPTTNTNFSKTFEEHRDLEDMEKETVVVSQGDQASVTTEDNETKPSAKETSEICLVMPSLSSDEENDDSDNDYVMNNVKSESNHTTQEASQTTQEVLSRSDWISGNQSVAPGDLIPTSTAYNTTSEEKHSPGSYPSYSVLSVEKELSADRWQERQYSVSSEAYCSPEQNHTTSSDVPNHISVAAERDKELGWSECDIPIFSVKEDSSPSPKSSPAKSLRTNSIWSSEMTKIESNKKLMKEETTMDNEAAKKVKEALKFRQSDLTKAEHQMYLKYFNKYVKPYMSGGQPPAFAQQQMKELAVFERLQQRVLNEQAEFQNYLWENAQKNSKVYSMLKAAQKHYASSRAQSYRLNKRSLSQFSQVLLSQISLNPEPGSSELKFDKTLLEVGTPPRIHLPDTQSGTKPVTIPQEIHKLDTFFPRNSRKDMLGLIHHEPISADSNMKKLSAKYNIHVALSSSVMKCLLNNHGPDFGRTWHIPCTVKENYSQGRKHAMVYLDKPVFEDDLQMRDYSTLYHKYAFRTFISHPKHKLSKEARLNLYQKSSGASSQADDLFDSCSASISNLETFGTGAGLKRSATINAISDEPDNVSSKKLKSSAGSCDGVGSMKANSEEPEAALREEEKTSTSDQIKRRNVRKNNDTCASQKADDGSSVDRTLPKCVPVPSDVEKTQQSSSKVLDHSTGVSCVLDGSDKVSCSSTDDGAMSSPAPRRSSRLVAKRSKGDGLKSSKSLRSGNVQSTPQLDIQSPGRVDMKLNPTTKDLSSKTEESQNQMCNINTEKNDSRSPNLLSSQKAHASLPVASELASIDRDTHHPARTDMPSSPDKEMSATQEHNEREVTCPVIIPLTLQESPDSKISAPSGRNPSTETRRSAAQAATHSKSFSLLDSILGPTFGTDAGHDKSTSLEDPSKYSPPTEPCSSIVYNLWSIDNINVMIRCRCQGILKDHKKTRRIYVSPKMEYQTTHGLEQVTVNEIARDWTSCFIRPNTNLLRVRISAFSSEIMMLEELESSQILQSSLDFKPESKFQFLEKLFRQLLSLEPGQYLLMHEAGTDHCGIHSQRQGASSGRCEPENILHKKRKGVSGAPPWIPIDPTILLPYHVANNRIPATFLPKDFDVSKFAAGGKSRSSKYNQGFQQGQRGRKNKRRKR